MDHTIDLTEILALEVASYADARTYKGETYYFQDEQRERYAVLVVPDFPRPFPVRAVVMARIQNDLVIIDEDTTDRPLVEALVRAGIPREQIVLAYAGEELDSEAGS